MRRHTFLTVGTQFGIQAVGVVTGIIVARLLGPTGRGQLAAIVAWVTMMTYVGDLGLPVAYTYRAALGGGSTPRYLVGNALVATSIQSLALAGLGSVVLPLTLSHEGARIVRLSVTYLWAYVPLNLLTRYANAVQQGSGRYGPFNAIRLSVPLSYLAFLVPIAFVGEDSVRSVVMANIASNVVALLLALWVTARVLWLFRSSAGEMRWFDLNALWRDLRYGLSAHIGTLQPFNRLKIDVLLLSILLTAHDVGLYVAALAAAGLLKAQGFAFGLVALPEVARRSELRQQRRLVQRLTMATAVITGAAAICAIVWARPLLVLVYGAEFGPAAPVMRVLVVGGAMAALYRVVGDALRGAGYPLRSTVAELVGVAIGLPAVAVLAPVGGATGAAVGVALGAFASLAAALVGSVRAGLLLPGGASSRGTHVGESEA